MGISIYSAKVIIYNAYIILKFYISLVISKIILTNTQRAPLVYLTNTLELPG